MQRESQPSVRYTYIPSDQRLEIGHLRFHTRVLKLRRDESHQVVQIWPSRHPVCRVRHVGRFLMDHKAIPRSSELRTDLAEPKRRPRVQPVDDRLSWGFPDLCRSRLGIALVFALTIRRRDIVDDSF
jgi:hypothetical protein